MVVDTRALGTDRLDVGGDWRLKGGSAGGRLLGPMDARRGALIVGDEWIHGNKLEI